MSFNESNTVEQMILDAVGPSSRGASTRRRRTLGLCARASTSAPDRRRHGGAWVREALIRLNPEIAAQPDRADEVIYKLRACILSVQADGLVRANENFMAWLRGEKTMPFGPNGEHVSVRLVDFDAAGQQPADGRATSGPTRPAAVEKRFDVVFLVNGLPLVIGEAKTPTRSAVTWFDGAFQVNEIYEKQVPAMFVPNVFSFATEGKLFRYGSIRMPIDMWGPWRDEENQQEGQLRHVQGHRREHAPAGGGARHPAELHALRHGQEAPAHQDHLPLPAVRHHQPDRRARGEGLSEEGPHLAFPGQRQVAADGLRRAEAAAAPEARQSHGDHRGGPHRPRHADHRHLQRRRRAEHGRRGHAAGVADAARRRTCARCSSPPSTSSARPAAS